MDDTHKMLRAIINGQSAIKEEMLKEIKDVRKEINDVRKDLNILKEKTISGFEKVNDRMDKIGKQLAYLEDDAPTREEFDEITTKVEKLSQNAS